MSEISRKIPMRYVYTIIAVVALSMVSLLFYAVSERVGNTERYTSLFGGKYFTEQELIQIEMAFASAKLSDYQILDGVVQVPKRQKNAFILALKKTEIFVDENEKSSAGSGFWTSDGEREAEAISAKQDALATQIRTFNGIENARVLLDISETKTGFTREKHATAAISIRSRRGYQVQTADIQSILRLVTGAVCELSPSDVSIVDTRTNQSWRFDAPEIEAGNGNLQEVAEYQKITFQEETLSNPEIFDSVARDMLTNRTFALNSDSSVETSLTDEMKAETEMMTGMAVEEETDSVFVPGRLKLGEGEVSSCQWAVALDMKNDENTEYNPRNSQILLTSATVAGQSSSGMLPEILPEMTTERLAETGEAEEQELTATLTFGDKNRGMTLPPMMSLFLGMVATLVIFLCIFVFYLTRKGLFVATPKVVTAENTETEKAEEDFREELLREIVTEPEETVQVTEREVEKESVVIPVGIQDEKPTENTEARLNAILETLGNIRNEEKTPENTVLERERIPEVEALFSASPQPLALAFMEERPQTAAMLLAEFSQIQRQEILAFIPTKSRLEIESRLTSCSLPDTDILREAAIAIQEHVADLNLEKTEKKTQETISLEPEPMVSPIRPLAEVLPHENEAETVVETVSEMKTDAEIEAETETELLVYHFEDLKQLSEEDLRSLLMVCPQSDALLAFLGAEPALVERVLRILPKAEAAQVRYQLKHPGRIRLIDVEYARQRILRLAQNLAKQGKLPSLEMVEA